MDKRLMLEVIPGPAFLIGNVVGGIYAGAGLAVLLRWRSDRSLPWMAVSILGLTLVLLGAGQVLQDATWIKISNTVGSLAFAGIIAAGALARAAANELVLRTASDQLWALYNGLSDIGWIGVSILITCLTARRFWDLRD